MGSRRINSWCFFCYPTVLDKLTCLPTNAPIRHLPIFVVSVENDARTQEMCAETIQLPLVARCRLFFFLLSQPRPVVTSPLLSQTGNSNLSTSILYGVQVVFSVPSCHDKQGRATTNRVVWWVKKAIAKVRATEINYW